MSKAVLFDMDGVLIDSEVVMMQAAIEGMRSLGVEASPEDFLPYVGTGEDAYLGNVFQKYGGVYTPAVKAHVYDVYGEMIAAKYSCPMAAEIIQALTEKHIPFAICSSADKAKIHHNLRALGIPENAFPAIISGEDVTKNKPDPEIYQKGAEKLGVCTQECIVVEDTLNGIRAGKRSGAQTVAVGTSSSRSDFMNAGNADYYISALPWLVHILAQNGLPLDLPAPASKSLLEAHRGVGTEQVENTMAAYRLAVEQGYDVIELDTKFTADHHCVLLHDRTINRTADQLKGHDNAQLAVAGLTYEELCTYTFGGEKIPDLEETLHFAAENTIQLKFDNVWRTHTEEEQQTFLHTIAASPAVHLVGITVSDLPSVDAVLAVLPMCHIHYDGPVTEEILASLHARVPYNRLTVWMRYDNAATAWNKNLPVTQEYSRLIHRYGMLGVWLLTKEEERTKAMQEYNADIIETDGSLKPVRNS